MDFLSFPLIFVLFSFSIFYLLFLHPPRTTKPTSTNGGFKHYPLVGTLPIFLANRHRFLEWTAATLSTSPFNTSVFKRPGRVHGVITANPAVVEQILKTNFHKYPKGERFRSLLEDFLGKGIFNVDGELWRLQRKIASHEFSKKSLRDFMSDCVRYEIHNRLLPRLKEAAAKGTILDLQDVLERFAFDNICKVAFNVDPHSLSTTDQSTQPEFMQAFDQATTLSSGRFFTIHPILWRIRKFLNIGAERQLRKAIQIVHQFADDIIKQRLEQKQLELKTPHSSCRTQEEDLLSRFIDSGEFNSPELLRDIVVSFILAGRDTTSAAVTWFFWLLSSRPEILRKIRAEVDSVRIKAGKPAGEAEVFNYEEVKEMHYLQAAISESMRLYPPVPVDTKACIEDDILPDGIKVGKGWFVSYDIYAMGRMEGIWGKDCREFKPERWLDESGTSCKVESPFRYPVFQAGPRICLGKEMAYVQMKSVVASVVEKFDVEVVDEEGNNKERQYVLAMTLRMKGGLPVRVKERRGL